MFSPPTLHPRILFNAEERRNAATEIRRLVAERPLLLDVVVTTEEIDVPLTTVSKAGSFDAFINVRLRGAPSGSDSIQLLVDSGNSSMVLPYWEHIEELPNWQNTYTLLGSGLDPWGNRANIVKGPIDIPSADGSMLSIDDCTFYAGTADTGNPEYPRIANFGTGCITNWQNDGGAVLQPPVSLLMDYPVAAFHYAPAEAVFSLTGALNVAAGSTLTLYKEAPTDVQWFDIIPDCLWMALVPDALAVGTTKTAWPDHQSNLIAMIDTGGTCAYLSDPEEVLAVVTQTNPPASPDWTSTSDTCHAVSEPITITLSDTKASIDIAIDTSTLPPSVQGLTLVMCKKCDFMMGMNGMNVGGITALFATIFIDYAGKRVGFRFS